GARFQLSSRSRITAVAFSPHGRTLVTGDVSGAIQVWDCATGQEHRRFLGHAGWIDRLTFSPDGRLLASGGADKTVLVWDVSSAEQRAATGHLSAEDLAALWNDLASNDAAVAHRAMWKLVGAGEQAVRFLRQHL